MKTNSNYGANVVLVLVIVLCLIVIVPVQADRDVTRGSSPENEPMIVINPLDHDKLVVGYNDYLSGWHAVWAWSDNNGAGWTQGSGHTLAGYTKSADPVIAFNSTGVCYFAGLAYNLVSNSPEDGSIFIATSADGGHTFGTPNVIAVGTGTSNYLDKPWMYINPYNDHIYVAWVKRVNLYNAATEQMSIWFSQSTDGGANFSTPIKISNFSPETGTNRSHGPQITASSANDVFVSWHTLEAGNPVTTPFRIFIAHSFDGGTSFGTNYEAVEANYGFPTKFISMDVDPSTGRLYIAYADSPVSSPRNYDVYVISSTSASGPWSAPVRVNSNSSNWQFWPALDVTPGGRVDVVWYDQRSVQWESEVFYSSSNDGGVTFSANQQVSSPTTGFDWPNGFAGDYLSIASVSEKTVMAWMDNRDAGPGYDYLDIYMATEATGYEAPYLLAPTNGITTENNLPTFSWSGIADYYSIEIATDPTFAHIVASVSPIYGLSYTVTTPLDFSDYDYQPLSGPHDPNYYWRVKAHYSPSGESEFSQASTVIITGPAEVPSEYTTISDARSSFPMFIGGTVLVAPGTYTGPGNYNIFMGAEKPVTVMSTDGPEVTIIDCQGSNYGFFFDLYTVGGVVDGFTVQNAGGSGDMEAAFVCWTGSATIRNCIIDNSSGPAVKAFRGGGASVYNTIIRNGDEGAIVTSGGRLSFVGCEFYNLYGWGIEAHDRDGGYASSLDVDSCLFYNNSQGDIIIWGVNEVAISNTTIIPSATGIWFYGGTDVSTVSNTIVAHSPSRGVYWTQTNNSVEFSCCDFYGNGSGDWTDRTTAQLGLRGNISADPEFCDTTAGIYGLQPSSPCTDANSGCGGMGTLDVCQGYTPTGNNVAVNVSDQVTVTFGQVTSPGETTVDLLGPGDTQTPADFSMQPTSNPILYQVNTTATVALPITICFEYDPAQVVGDEMDLRLLHSDGSEPIMWDDITILPVDVTNNIICGSPPSLSPFIMGFWCCGKFQPSNLTGNTDCDTEGKRNLADITRLIDRVYLSKVVLCCESEGNVDGDSSNKINLADITRLIDHIYISKGETAACL